MPRLLPSPVRIGVAAAERGAHGIFSGRKRARRWSAPGRTGASVMQGEVALARGAESIGDWVKQRIKWLLGDERLTMLRLAPLHRAIGKYGWNVDDLCMTDRQAAEHYANERELDVVFRTIVRFFHEYKLCFIRGPLGEEYIRRSRFLEVGDSDGLVLQALGKGELSINNDPRCVELIRRNGVQAHLGLAER